MLVIRATLKLLERLGPPEADPPQSTTVLGDWYAKPFGIAQKRYVLFISEKSRIAVLMPGRDVANLPRNFPDALAVQLAGLGIPQDAIDREVAACRDFVVATTANNKSLLGTLNDFASMTKFRFPGGDGLDVEAESLYLSHTPLSALGWAFAADVARKLFGLEPYRRSRPS